MNHSSIIRLDRTKAGHFGLYQQFDWRCRDFVEKYNQSKFPTPIEAISLEMLNRWINQPDLAGYFLGFDKNGHLSGHLASWLLNYYGLTKLFIWQAEAQGESLLEPLIEALRSWLDSVNAKLPPAQQCHRIELVTWHNEALWKRYLRKVNLEPELVQSIMEIAI